MGHFLGLFLPSVDISEGLVLGSLALGCGGGEAAREETACPENVARDHDALGSPSGKLWGGGLLLAEGAEVVVLALAVSERSEEPQVCPGVALRRCGRKQDWKQDQARGLGIGRKPTLHCVS